MLRLCFALAVLLCSSLGILWVLELISPETARDLLVKGAAVLAIAAAAGAALAAVARTGKKPDQEGR